MLTYPTLTLTDILHKLAKPILAIYQYQKVQSHPYILSYNAYSGHTVRPIISYKVASHTTPASMYYLAVTGRIVVTIEQANGNLEVFRLKSSHVGLYVPPNVWHTLQY
jgi:hypothetical protein